MKIKKIILFLLILLTSNKSLFAEDFRDVRLKELTLEGDNTFSGTIYIEGRITVNENASLLINPGTRVIFIFLDDDRDGIGESEILSQGRVTVLGSKDKPVVFESDRKEKGSWLGFSIMSVDSESVLNYAVFEDAYMALHSHFSNLKILNTIFRNNMRGFQSQEGKISIQNCSFYNNNTALQFRNSKAEVVSTSLYNNIGGINFLYSDVILKNIEINNNSLFGIKVRFSKAEISNLSIFDSMQNFYGKNSEIRADRIFSKGALLRGLSFESSDVEINSGEISNNLLDGISLDSSILTGENITFTKNGRFDIYLKGNSDIKGFEGAYGLRLYKE
ncbi:MAG: hypothetical protein N2999_03185 [Proteobacteria bacterium]|nr:hypothetical protein [Pseudomonadota bacterium]